jgi:plasmid replication initiation protein
MKSSQYPEESGLLFDFDETKLLPDRHPQSDLFICDVADAVLKDDMATMEHPFFSLSKKPETKPRKYVNGDRWVEIVPSVKGLATIYDKDVLIYCISQMIAKANMGSAITPYVKIVARDLLIFINRTTGGKDYEALRDALDRLDGTRIRTNVKTGGEEEHSGFGLIDSFSIKRSQKTGKIIEMEVKLSDWVFRSIASKEVLTLSRDYFRLKKPIERRIYEIARKHCGKQDHWKIKLELLKAKCGSSGTLDKFRYIVREIAQGNHLPDYLVSLDKQNIVHFHARKYGTDNTPADKDKANFPVLDADAYRDAQLVAPGYDITELETQWQQWWDDSGRVELKNPAKAFVGFCKKKYERELKS